LAQIAANDSGYIASYIVYGDVMERADVAIVGFFIVLALAIAAGVFLVPH
jgi:hypothetical protein